MNTQELRTNKQELISKYELLKNSYNFDVVAIDDIISDLKRLDEPQKVKIPQTVADWIDACKENLAIGLYIAMNPDFLKQWNQSDELISWSRKTSNQELFARAWLDGYEVKKEPKYKVKFKGVLKNNNYLNYNSELKNWYHASSLEIGMVRTKFTRKELEEAGFGWVFDCPGIEIEEVEE